MSRKTSQEYQQCTNDCKVKYSAAYCDDYVESAEEINADFAKNLYNIYKEAHEKSVKDYEDKVQSIAEALRAMREQIENIEKSS